MTGVASALLLLAHGSRDVRSVEATGNLRRAVMNAMPSTLVRHSFLDLSTPGTGQVLAELADAGCRHVVAVPLLLTAAYHSRVDVPQVLALAPPGMVVRPAGVLGPHPLLVDAMIRRLGPARDCDAVVLAAAGSSDPAAIASVGRVAAMLGQRYGRPCLPGLVSASPGVAEAVRELRRVGARRVAVASYFVAPGFLHDRCLAAAWDAGAVVVTDPLVAVPGRVAPELVRVVEDRWIAARQRTPVVV